MHSKIPLNLLFAIMPRPPYWTRSRPTHPTPCPTLRQRAVGGATEIGVDFRVNEHAHVDAELRWIDIDRDAIAIRTRPGPVAADPVMLGVSLRWRFH